MKVLTAGEVKSSFSTVLAQVQRGEHFTVSYGRKRKPVALIVPFAPHLQSRRLGQLAGRGHFAWREDDEITDRELLDS